MAQNNTLPSQEATSQIRFFYLSNGVWKTFSGQTQNAMDGIKIQTNLNSPYYLRYRTRSRGKTGFSPCVRSNRNDYAGSAGEPIQSLSIDAYESGGAKLTIGVVVMYRAYVNGSWLPWVSNADPERMRSVHSKYNLGGTLDTSGSFTGLSEEDIGGIEIRVFEENSESAAPKTRAGNYKIIQVPFLSQLEKYPTGCESVTAVMALNYAGVDLSVDEFIDTDLDRSGVPFDPNLTFGGNPRSESSYGCYAPVIKKALDRALSGRNTAVKVLSGVSLKTLCSEYIDQDIPVILWATLYMNPPHADLTWSFNNKMIQWIAPEHCLLLVGYDDNNYIFNDPMQTRALKYYGKPSVEAAYKGLFSQAVVIVEKQKSADPLEP